VELLAAVHPLQVKFMMAKYSIFVENLVKLAELEEYHLVVVL
jgi:hypothetical protein